MKSRILPLTFMVIGLVLIAIGVLTAGLYVEKKTEEKTVLSEKEATEYIDKITRALIYGESRQELQDLLYVKDDELLNTDLMSGPDMYLRQWPDKNVAEEDLSSYQDKGDLLAKNLEKQIQDNLEYTIEGTADGGDYWNVLVRYRSYYYQAYLKDLSQIQVQLLSLAGYQMDGSNVQATDDFKVDTYKAKIKAASILDSHLSDYINTQEENQTYVKFNGKKVKNSSDAFMSYVMNLSGYSYQFQGFIQTEDQINQYLTEASIDYNNPLAL
ncbi:MAG TPA: hypothetical protein IAD45_01100 [Candidatus Faecimonas intestinavium]|nr:hypothetical protein [Candidatus Faecimonas intestinavium]